MFHGLAAPAFVAAVLAPLVGRGGRRLAVVRGAILAAPIVLVIGLLLSSADAVFASFFKVSLDPASLASHAVLLVMGGWGMAGLLCIAAAAPIETDSDAARPAPHHVLPVKTRTGVRVFTAKTARGRPIGAVEATTVLACLVALFAAFAVSQLVALSGSGQRVIETAGLS